MLRQAKQLSIICGPVYPFPFRLQVRLMTQGFCRKLESFYTSITEKSALDDANLEIRWVFGYLEAIGTTQRVGNESLRFPALNSLLGRKLSAAIPTDGGRSLDCLGAVGAYLLALLHPTGLRFQMLPERVCCGVRQAAGIFP